MLAIAGAHLLAGKSTGIGLAFQNVSTMSQRHIA